MAKVGVVLSGCGLMDGSEIHEAACALLALNQAGADYQCMAPNAPQMNVMDHLKGQPVAGQSRNVLVESARIARGEIIPLGEVKATDYDAFVFPGGFGAAKNLCTFAVEGGSCSVLPDVARIVLEAFAAGKPQCFICIAPVIAAKVLGRETGVKLTIGTDPDTAAAIESMGAKHVERPPTEALVDAENKVVSTPAYMSGRSIGEVFEGISAAVGELLKLAG